MSDLSTAEANNDAAIKAFAKAKNNIVKTAKDIQVKDKVVK